MEHIQDIYKEKPEVIEELLSKHLSKINLKVDGKPFQVVYNEETDELEFHGRSGNETTVGPLITDYDRYFSKFLNDAIRHIESRVDLFKRYKFMTIEIIDNELLLTSVVTKNNEFVNSPKKIREIANELETEVMPTLWEGQLSKEQYNSLIDIIKTGEVPTKKEFIDLVKNLFSSDPNFPKKLIMANTEFIEGIVFFFDVKGKIVEYKLVDPAFRAQSAGYKASSKEEKDKNKDTYNKLYEFFLDWVEKNGEKLADNRIHSIEKNFIKMMSDSKTYNKVMNLASGVRVNNIARYGVQLDRTTPELAKEIRKKGDMYKTVYEIFFNMFKKPKKRNYTINKEFQMKVNDAITLFEGIEGYENFANDLLEENLIYETKFSPKLYEYDKHGYGYPVAVMHYLLDNCDDNNEGTIKCGEHGEEEKTYKIVDKEELEKLMDKLESNLFTPNLSTYHDFNELVKIGDKPAWSQIFKGTFSGYENMGGMLGQIYESLVAYLFNKGEKANIDKWHEFTKTKPNKSWIESSKETVKLINTLAKNKEYTCYHVDGRDYDLKVNGKEKFIVDIFAYNIEKGNKIVKALKKKQSDKNKWNPADIVLLKNSDINKTYELLNNIDTNSEEAYEAIQAALKVLILPPENNPSIIPISLKKLDVKKGGSVKLHKDDDISKIDFVNLILPVSSTADTVDIIVKDMSGTEYKVDFRKGSNDKLLAIEARKSKGNARLGRGVVPIKALLGLSKKDTFNEDIYIYKELYDSLKNSINIKNDKDIEDLKQCIGIKGVLWLFDIYRQKEDISKLTIKEQFDKFAQLCFSCCVDCPSIYYIIS